MSAKAETISFGTSRSGAIDAFAVRPDTPAPWPALILIHGINGTGPHTDAKAAEFAGEGYFTVVPDIYTNDAVFQSFDRATVLVAAHMGGDAEHQQKFLATQPEEKRVELLRARQWIADRPTATYGDIIRGCFDYLASRPDVGAIGAIGYCMGGRLVGELAVSGVELAAGVICYGGHPNLDNVGNIRGPIQGHYASTDHPITDKVPAFAAAMKAAGKDFTSYIYEAHHGFSRIPGSSNYNAAATALSLERIKPFLARNLKAAVAAPAPV